ncbi:MAG: RelA/SpoT family protein [Muribaculaceae bacterium]|nr:RelA/SpoT family protein [Muribaculaceae bacterium]
MAELNITKQERDELLSLYRDIRRGTNTLFSPAEAHRLHHLIRDVYGSGALSRDRFGFHPIIMSMRTAKALCDMISPDRHMIIAILVHNLSDNGLLSHDMAVEQWGSDVGKLIEGLRKVSTLYEKQTKLADENFSKLLMTFAQDIRVIIIMIMNRLVLMRAINHHPDEEHVKEVAIEAGYLYAPIAHRLGLYKIKGELEDMSLKYTNRDIYTRIARKLNETKKSRDAYIAAFIAPVKAALEREGLKFDIKGRTKSIYSIWNKMKKQNNDVDHIYDLFAIRIILDAPEDRERKECWLAYSIVADMYQPNPARFKDWLTIPKSNGYESLHTTVTGPDKKWVEVQIRSRRMDEIAEKGVAAHWKYKGIKSENNLDTWMNRVRDILEAGDSGPLELMKNMDMDLYNKEIFVFTPKGDLYKLPKGATLLDFAFNIHSKLGCTCVGGKVDGKSRKLNYKLKSGDTVEILTSASQAPKQDWLSFVVTSKARSKIRQTLKERENKASELAKELLQRRFKNRKIELDESVLMRVIKKLGFKSVTEFYSEIASERLDVNDVIADYEAFDAKSAPAVEARSAEEFTLNQDVKEGESGSDVLVIGDNVKGLNYRLAKCCNPIYGDKVFGFISSEGVIKIHRDDCPNARNIRERYPYRVITTRWSGKSGAQFAATLRVVGHDDIGIVTNITSIINKEKDVDLRRIEIQSNDGIFQGHLVLGVANTVALNNVIKKIKTVKGVKDATRSN